MRKLYILGLIILAIVIIGFAWADDITLTTYYPAPYGVYNDMVVMNSLGIGTTDPKSKLHVVGLPVYANNATAIAGGLTVGAFYRTGVDDPDPDPVCVVY